MSGAPELLPQRTAILRAAIGIGIYAGAFGMSFGAVSIASGFTVLQTCLISLVMFSGASQFAFVGIAAAASPLAAVPTALLLAVRNAFYGIPVADILGPRGWRKLVTAHFVIDETTAMAVGQASPTARRYAFWSTGVILFALWQLGTLAGALLGSAIDTRSFGLDAASPAVFLALLWPRLRANTNRRVAAIGAGIAVLLIPIAPAGVPVIAAAAVALVAGLLPPRAVRATA